MPYEPTKLERQAENNAYKALLGIEDVIDHLRAAERAPHVGIANQHRLEAYAEITSDLIGVRRQIVQRITGEPNPKAAA